MCGQADESIQFYAGMRDIPGSEKTYMNSYIRLEITNQVMNCNSFLMACKRDALKDDGKIDKQEKKQLEKLEKATQKYVKELEKVAKVRRNAT